MSDKIKQSNDFLGYFEIPGYSKYVINRTGDVLNIITNKKLKGSLNPDGYFVYRLTDDTGTTLTWGRYRLLGYVFKRPLGPISDLVINHEDGDKGNDDLDNLEWCTYQENAEHAGRMGLTTKCIPISVRDVDTGEVIDYPSVTAYARTINLSKDAILYRLSRGERHVFPERKQYRFAKLTTPWIIPEDVDKTILANGTNKTILLRNVITDEVMTFSKLKDLANYLNISPSTVTLWLSKKNQPVLPGFYQIKLGWDLTPWRKVEDPKAELYKFINSKKAVKITHVETGVSKVFDSAIQCANEMGLTASALNYRLKSTGSVVYNDGYTYDYYSI